MSSPGLGLAARRSLSPLALALVLVAGGALGCSSGMGGLIRAGSSELGAAFGYTPTGVAEHVSGHAICAHPSGDAIVAGYLHGETYFGAVAAQSPADASAVFVGRFSPSGDPRWLWQANGTEIGVAVDPAGGVFVIAMSELLKFSDPPRDAASVGRSPALYSLSPDGSIRWSHRFPSFGREEAITPTRIAAAPDGGVFVAGKLGDSFDGFVARFTASGERRWFRGVEMNGSSSYITDLSVGPEGDLLLTGKHHGVLRVDEITRTRTTEHAFVTRLSGEQGRARWLRLLGSEECSSEASAVAVSARDEIFVGGMTDCRAPLIAGAAPPRARGIRPYVVRLAGATGEPVWTREFAGDTETFASGFLQDLAIDAAGHPIAAMYQSHDITVSYGGLLLTTGKEYDGVLLGLDREGGATRWSHVSRGEARFEGDAHTLPNALAVDANGRVLVTGSFTGEVDFGGATLESPSGSRDTCPKGEGAMARDLPEGDGDASCGDRPWVATSMFMLRIPPGKAR